MSNSDAESAGALERATQTAAEELQLLSPRGDAEDGEHCFAMHPEPRVGTETAGNIGSGGSAQ